MNPSTIAASLAVFSLAASPRPVRPAVAPDSLLAAARKAVTASGWCDRKNFKDPAPLGAEVFASLPDGKLLFFLQIPDYLCSMSNTALPVTVDAKGRFRWGGGLAGQVTRLARREGGRLVAVSQWQIEGTYPALSESLDGIAWKEIPLPEPRETQGPDEVAEELCEVGGELRLRLASESAAKSQSWALPAQGSWKSIARAGCPPAEDLSGGWRRTATESAAEFTREGRAVRVPARLSPRPGK